MEETNTKHSNECYKGDLERLFQHPLVQKYLDDNVIVYGYLGHEFRTSETDSFLENTLDLANNQAKYEELYDILAEWICSRSARHLMDTYGQNDEDLKTNIAASILRYYICDYNPKSPLMNLVSKGYFKVKEMLL